MSVEELIHSSDGVITRNWRKIDTLTYFNFMPVNFKKDRLLGIVQDYDPLTFDHMKQVAYWTEQLENILGTNSSDLRLAASLHDVGKIGIPLQVLHPSDYTMVTPEEKELRRKHIDHSVTILRKLRFPERVVKLVSVHETPFSEIKNEADLYQGTYFLPSIIRVADVLVAALENPEKYGKADFKDVIVEVVRQVDEGFIQPDTVITGKERWLTLVDLYNEHSSHLPKPIARNV